MSPDRVSPNSLGRRVSNPPLLLLLFRFFPLFGSCSGQRELEIDVAFVARILNKLLLIRQPPHDEFYAVRFGPGFKPAPTSLAVPLLPSLWPALQTT